MSLLGIDVGTTGCKAAVFAEGGRCIAQAYREYRTLSPREGWTELDSGEVWRKTGEVVREAAAGAKGDPVTALSAGSFGEGFVPVTRDRRILRNTILCTDSRGGERIADLEREMGQEAFYRINPNILGPQYSLPKMLWMREAEPELFDRADFLLLWADLVGFMLGGDPVTNSSHANRTLLFDLDRNDWSDRLLEWSGIPRAKLGRVVSGGTVIGEVSNSAAREFGLPCGAKVVAGGHDQCCNGLGCGGIRAGLGICGIGTFECLMPIYRKPADPLGMMRAGLNIEHHVLPDLFVSFLFNQGGVLVKWFRDTFASADRPPAGRDLYDALNGEMPDEPTGLLTLPHFEPCFFPRHIPDSAGVLLGLRTTTTRGEILKSIMECETLYFADSLQALRDLGVETTEFMAAGGGAKSDRWLQIKADVLGVPITRPRVTEAGLAGAAMLAGMSTGVFRDAGEAVARFVEKGRTFEPDPRRQAIYREKLALYRELFPAVHGILKRLQPKVAP